MKNKFMFEFNGEKYFDDRIYVLYLCKGTVEIEPGFDGSVWTTIYHQEAPKDYVWCVVTYKNSPRYPLYRIDSFHKKEDAILYMKEIEPKTPLISLGGNSPKEILSYEDYVLWKMTNSFKDYDWKSLYTSGGTNAQESIGQTKEQFNGIK